VAAASVRGILRNPAYAGRALTNRTRVVPARRRKSAMLPVGPGQSHAPRPEQDWIEVPVPPVVSEDIFAQVQAKLDTNQQTALRNTRHEYLLRALVSCGACGLSCVVRQTPASYRYYLCRGRTDGCGWRRDSAAPPATSPLTSSTSWSGRTCARC
jgi:site-specific DNA recombinase